MTTAEKNSVDLYESTRAYKLFNAGNFSEFNYAVYLLLMNLIKIEIPIEERYNFLLSLFEIKEQKWSDRNFGDGTSNMISLYALQDDTRSGVRSVVARGTELEYAITSYAEFISNGKTFVNKKNAKGMKLQRREVEMDDKWLTSLPDFSAMSEMEIIDMLEDVKKAPFSRVVKDCFLSMRVMGLSSGEVSEYVGKSPQTVRRYAKEIGDHLNKLT